MKRLLAGLALAAVAAFACAATSPPATTSMPNPVAYNAIDQGTPTTLLQHDSVRASGALERQRAVDFAGATVIEMKEPAKVADKKEGSKRKQDSAQALQWYPLLL